LRGGPLRVPRPDGEWNSASSSIGTFHRMLRQQRGNARYEL